MMATTLVAALLVAALLVACSKAPPPPIAPPPPDPCAAARTALDAHLETLPRQCNTDAECRAQYVRVDPCLPPVVTAAAWDPDADVRLRELQAAARSSCAAGAACEPVLLSPGCRLGQCVDDKGSSGTAKRVCAPGGGTAWSFFFTDGQEANCDQAAYPSITATIWHDVDAGDLFRIDSAKRGSGVLMRCQANGSCVTGGGTVRITGKQDGGHLVDLEATFDGETVHQSFFARPCPSEDHCR